MRLSIALLSAFYLIPASVAGQVEQNDPYSAKFIQITIKNRAQGLMVAKSQTHLARMGDGISIALLKALSDSELLDTNLINVYLPIIREAFSEPQSVTTEIDKKPAVTLFLLKYLQNSVSNGKTRRQIEETIQFIKRKTGQ